jgi:hypothetical protein
LEREEIQDKEEKNKDPNYKNIWIQITTKIKRKIHGRKSRGRVPVSCLALSRTKASNPGRGPAEIRKMHLGLERADPRWPPALPSASTMGDRSDAQPLQSAEINGKTGGEQKSLVPSPRLVRPSATPQTPWHPNHKSKSENI